MEQVINEGCKLNACNEVSSYQYLKCFLTRELIARSIWLTDEKTFTVATPVNYQSDRVYFDVRKESKFQQQDSHANVDISVQASWFRQSKTPRSFSLFRMGNSNVVFVGPEVKVNSKYYCDHHAL